MIAIDLADLVVIDDDEDLRMLTQLTFELQGWSVMTAPDGMVGIQMLDDLVARGITPAVLLDIQMPGIDGWEVLVHVRKRPRLRDLPVILCTVRAGDHDRLRGFELGADEFVAKPFDIDELVDAVTAVVSLTPAERSARRAGRAGPTLS